MQVYSTGPARVWVAFPTGVQIATSLQLPSTNGWYSSLSPAVQTNLAGSSLAGTPTPFCTCERAPKIREMTDYEPVMNDLGGTKKEFDSLHEGTDAMVAGIATRWREPIARALAETPRYTGIGIRGDALGDLGTCMILEGRTVTVYVEYMYGNAGSGVQKAAMTGGGMGPGLRFLACKWMPVEHDVGTGPKKLTWMFHAMRVYSTVTGSMAYADEVMTPLDGLAWEVIP